MIFYKNGHEIRTWVSPDGKSMHASISTKPGPSGSMRHYSTEDGQYVAEGAVLSTSGQIASDAGGISGGNAKKYPPPPPAPKEPHLVYSIESHKLRDPDGGGIAANDAYSGKGQHRNRASSQHIEDFGPIPEGNWRLLEITDPHYFEKSLKLQRPVFRLEPDAETANRVGKDGMGRKPNTFLIHGDNKSNDASQGCIILNKTARERLRNYE